MLRRSVSRSGPVGFQPSCWRVSAQDAARSIWARSANQLKYSGASSGDRLDRHLQPRTNHLGDVAQGDTFLAYGVVARACLSLLQRQPVKRDGVGDEHGR